MLKVKINGSEVDFPTTVQDLSLKQMFALKKAKDILDEIAICTGIDRNKIENFKDLKTITAANALLATLRISIEAGFDGRTFPKTVTLGIKKIKVPSELRLQPIGAFMSVSDILAEYTNKMIKQAENEGREITTEDINYTDCIPKVLAHYFYLPYYGEDVLYSDTKAEDPEYMAKIMNLRLVDAVPLGNYFFLKYPNLT